MRYIPHIPSPLLVFMFLLIFWLPSPQIVAMIRGWELYFSFLGDCAGNAHSRIVTDIHRDEVGRGRV